jgi:anti-sigma factor RsiW
MNENDVHLSDDRLLLHLDGELPAREARSVSAHIDSCWRCRARRRQLQGAIEGFIRVHQDDLDSRLPAADGPRAMLRARLDELSSTVPTASGVTPARTWTLAWAAALLLGGVAAGWLLGDRSPSLHSSRSGRELAVPDSRLTPGAAVLLNSGAVCSEENVKNRTVPVALQRRVFAEYGIPAADPRGYEVDYLITPALGGADDIHNLWPQPYSAVWNAQVKDALEDHLRNLVCAGRLDLAQAQRDISQNWVRAYQKYFHTDLPLKQHQTAE